MIKVIHLFPELKKHLIELLESLSKEEWELNTCINRSVKELACHILDASNLRRLSMQRDGYFLPPPEINSYQDLVNFIQTTNKKFIEGTKYLSPQLIITLLKNAEDEFFEFIKTLEANDNAIWPVAWAGEETSKNWFDIARDYTEKWHHQMQIRLAVNKTEDLLIPTLTKTVYDAFMRALPHHYKEISAQLDNTIEFNITGACGGKWYLVKTTNNWKLSDDPKNIVSSIKVPDDIAWQLMTNSIRNNKESYLDILGNKELGLHFAKLVTVMS